ncbi:extensin family protein [Mesorhizobium sp.]|uniref:extensin-like domain-containing protein n=1 Tax=Mesorhizobium sp. TaxID=1871066 RepID=UPI0025FCCEA2|nr:extensin family protein [Mesorhizobium sp.]
MAATALLVTPADARHRHKYHQPLTPRMEQPLTQRADQSASPRYKHRVKPRGRKHVAPQPVKPEAAQPLQTQAPQPVEPEKQDETVAPAVVPVPEPRPKAAPDEADAETGRNLEQDKRDRAPADASDRLNEEKSRPQRQARPEPSAGESAVENEPEPPEVAPTPTPKPDTSKPDTPEPANTEPGTAEPGGAEPEAQTPPTAPKPPEKPADAGAAEKMLPDPRSADRPADKMPEEEVACRERLKALGVEFEEHKAESDPEIGCSIPYPIVLKSLGKSIAIAPGTELNCPMAEAAARFAADVVQPMAKADFGADLKSIDQASAFVCRPRHGTRKLSEHAFGNALDIASFKLSDGTEIKVGPTPPEKEAKFLNAVRKAACGPFKTVLGPGADADHTFHFHLDLEPRRHGGTFCQ